MRGRVAYLEVLRLAERAGRAQVREALVTVREVHPALGPEQLFHPGCRAVLAGPARPDDPDAGFLPSVARIPLSFARMPIAARAPVAM